MNQLSKVHKEQESFELEMKQKVGELIISLNVLEGGLKNVILTFINSSEKNFFIKEVLLNNLIVNFSAKFKVLQYIIQDLEIKIDTNFNNSVRVLMEKRNVIAHCDTILNNYTLVDIDFNDLGEIQQFWGEADPKASIIKEGKIKYENIQKVFEDYHKHYKLVHDELEKIYRIIEDKNLAKKTEVQSHLPLFWPTLENP